MPSLATSPPPRNHHLHPVLIETPSPPPLLYTDKGASGSVLSPTGLHLLGRAVPFSIYAVIIICISASFSATSRTILDICPRVEGVNFTDIPDNDTILAFLIKLGYKGPLYKHTNMFVDHMHQPWRTLAAIINKCLSGKTASNDKLRKSKIDILWGMFYRENVDYLELIWEDIAYHIDHRKDKRSRRKNMPFPRFTKVIINYFLKEHNSLSNLKFQHYHTIKDDGIVCRLKFVRIGEDYQEYGLSILETMLIEAIKQSKSYQMFIKYSTGQIHPKKSRGKGSQGKKNAVDSQEIVDVSEESEPEPESVKIKTSKLGKSIIQTGAKEAEAARQVHATYARVVTGSVLEPTKKIKSGKVTSDLTKKLKGVPSLTLEEQEAEDTMQALKESKKTSKRQIGTEGSNEGTGTIPRVPNESTVVSATSSERTGTKPGVPDKKKEITKENVILEWELEQESEHSEEDKLDDGVKDEKEGDADDEDDETESDEDDIYKYKIRVRKDEDEEMINAKVDDSYKGDEEVTDAAKADAEKTSEVKDDPKKTKLPPTSSSLSVSSGFGDQFLKLSSESSLVSIVKDTTDTEINSLLEVKIQSKVPHTQSPSVLSVLVSVISEPTVLTPVQESSSIATTTNQPPPSVSTTPSVPQQTTTPIPTPTITTDALTVTTAVLEFEALFVVQLRVAKLEKDVFDLNKIDLLAEALIALKTQVPSVVDNYLGSKVGDVFQKELKK
ncbi:hypothetical protein Tco_0670050 [Tanacetum coccineum]